MLPQQDEHFIGFIQNLERVKARHGTNTDALQEYQVNRLVELEKQFRKLLVRHRWGADVYQRFIAHILDNEDREKKGILMARPYFRERKDTFTEHISPALRERDHRALYRFNINWPFIDFVLKAKPWGRTRDSRKLLAIASQVEEIRRDIIECNIPLVISQARGFKRSNGRSHLTYMDLIQIGGEGLAAAVDKFVGPWAKNFRAVIIGRAIGNFIDANSETSIHFYPADKQRLYRVRKILARHDEEHIDWEVVLKELNRRATEDGLEQTTLGELINLVNASRVISASALPFEDGEEGDRNAIEAYPAEHENRPDILLEEAQAHRAVAKAISVLPLIDQKLLSLRGIEL